MASNSVEDQEQQEASNLLLDSQAKKLNNESRTQLKREIGLFDGTSIIVGIIVGSGIFVSPKGVLLYAESVGMSMLVWLVSGIMCLIGALCYAELGTMIPKSGGDYAYIIEAFGPLPAFLYLWVALLVIMPAGLAITALTFGYYILQPFWPECDAPLNAVRLVAAAVICLLTAVNCHQVKSVTKIQDVFTATKVLALIIIIVTGVLWLSFGHLENLGKPMQGSNFSPGSLALAFYSGLYSYAGWNHLNFVTEELKEPNKNLPRAIYLSMPIIIVIYVLANLAYFAVLTPVEILSSNAVAVTFSNRMLGVMSWTMPLFVACSTFGAVNGGIFASSRLFFVGARNGHMPKAMALISYHYLTPMPCLIFLGIISLLMLTSNDVFDLINYTSFVDSLFQLISVIGLLYLRYKRPDLERPIKVNLMFPILFTLICGFLVIFPIYDSPTLVGVDILILVLGVLVYLIFIKWKSKPKLIKQFLYSWDTAVQKFFLAVPEK